MTTVTTVAAPCTSCKGGSDLRGLERTRFFARQIVTPDDLTQDQIYFREKAKRHNRMLHGWGVVCGACVRRGGTACEVIVEPGYILGPYGDEIVIEKDTVVDICKLGAGEQDGCCGEELDPWCSDAKADCAAGTLYLAVKYSDCLARPVRGGAGCGCGCDESDCEYSRIRDSFTLRLLRELPAGYTTPMKQPPMASLNPCRGKAAKACPPCPDDPWVILADISIDAQCNVRAVNCFTHRRYVVSFADFFFVCAGKAPNADVGPILDTGIKTMVEGVRFMSMMSGTTNLMDTRGSMTGEAPRAMVTLARADGSTTMLPAYFTVERGSTVGDLLEREGDRSYYDPSTDRTYTLRELYRNAGVATSTKLESTAAALSPLEGRVLGAGTPVRPDAEPTPDASTTRPPTEPEHPRGGPRERLRDILDPSVLAELQSETDVSTLPVTSIAGLSATSALGKRVTEMTIGDVGAMSREAFIEHVTRDASARQRNQITRQAEQVWRSAQRATNPYAPEPEDTPGNPPTVD